MTHTAHGEIVANIWLYVARMGCSCTPAEVRAALYPDSKHNAVAQAMRLMAAAARLKRVGTDGHPRYMVTLGCEIPTRVTLREVLGATTIVDPTDLGLRRQVVESTSSLPPGVTRNPRAVAKPYGARIRLNGRKKHLGYFATANEAGDAYVAAAKARSHTGANLR